MLYVLMPEVMLNCPRIVVIVGQLTLSGMADQGLVTPSTKMRQYFTLNVGLSSGRFSRLSYRRVVQTLACPSHSWTLAMSTACSRALVAALTRRE